MAANLYEVLGVSRNATPEEIRRAYRRKALNTHPDRLPQGASPAEKSASEDLFRKVNNAYEVLNDTRSRALYDQHGVWPPPEPAPQGPFANGSRNPSSVPFFRDPFLHSPFFRGPHTDLSGGFGFGSRPDPRGFTDPFVLFDSIFGSLHRAFETDPFLDSPFARRGFGSNHFGGDLVNNNFPLVFPSPFDLSHGTWGGGMQSLSNGGSGGRWVSESWTNSNINGVTHTKCVRRDSDGNEHVTYRYPDGTERRTINGIEQPASQPSRALAPSAPPAPPASYPIQDVNVPPPPYSEAVAQPHFRPRSTRHHGRHGDYSGDRREHRHRHGHGHGHGHGHEYLSRDKGEGGREHEAERDEFGYRDDGRRYDAQGGSPWKFWKP